MVWGKRSSVGAAILNTCIFGVLMSRSSTSCVSVKRPKWVFSNVLIFAMISVESRARYQKSLTLVLYSFISDK